MLLSVRWYERVRRHYTVHCGARGIHAFGPAILRTGDVFGLTTQELEMPGEDYLLVYPQDRHPGAAGAAGPQPVRRHADAAPVAVRGSAAHRRRARLSPGDSPRRLHWKATARAPGQALQVKLFEPTTTHRLHVLLNVSTSSRTGRGRATIRRCSKPPSPPRRRSPTGRPSAAIQIGLAANARAVSLQRGGAAFRPAAIRAS